MISLPGLTLATGWPEIARRILQTFASFVSQGILPNVLPGSGDVPQYNTADASLWFFEAWRAYIDATGNLAALREAFPILSDMVEWHRKGTRYGIVVDGADGLLRAGMPGSQLSALEDQGLGTIGEIFDGDPPHHPRGAPAQASCVACTFDAWRTLTQAETKQ